MRSQKVLRLLLIIGLPIILLVPVIMYLYRNNKANWINRLVIRLSKYRQLSKYIFAQARLESANFTSNLYQKTNNCFGMQVPRKRPFLGKPSEFSEGGMDAKLLQFRNDTQSFRDYLLWLDYTKFPTFVNSDAQFVSELKKRGYFTSSESDYLKALRSWI